MRALIRARRHNSHRLDVGLRALILIGLLVTLTAICSRTPSSVAFGFGLKIMSAPTSRVPSPPVQKGVLPVSRGGVLPAVNEHGARVSPSWGPSPSRRCLEIAVHSELTEGLGSGVATARPPPSTSYLASNIERRLSDILKIPDGERGSGGELGSPLTRVIDSWRFLSMDYEHREYVGRDPEKSPETSNCHQQAHSYVPGLTTKTFWDIEGAEWREKLEAGFEEIRAEFSRVISDPESLAANAQNPWVSAQTEEARSYGTGWKTLGLLDRGVWDHVNTAIFPRTSEIIRDSGIPAVEAFFASLEPETSIKLHSDNANFVLTSHLPLIVPENGKNMCRLTVGDDTKEWLEGKMMMFDTSILHDAVNDTKEKRYILMFRVWHPELKPEERNALQFALDALSVPELVSEDGSERAQAEKQVKAMREFPDLRKLRPKVVARPTSAKQWKATLEDAEGGSSQPVSGTLSLENLASGKRKRKNKKSAKSGKKGGFG